MRVKSSILAAAACALLTAIPMTAATNETTTKTNKNTKTAVVQRAAWPPETVTGKIAKVDPDRKLVVVETPSGVPFDMVVTKKTRIESGNHAITLKELTRDMNRNASVKYTPERRGDVARSIQLGG
jgi:hypothetical protein